MIVICDYCNKSFETYLSTIKWNKIRGHKKTFCSKECKDNHYTAENNSNWIQDRSKIKDQNKSIRWSKDMNEWRKAVFERDNYTCRLCAERSRKDNPILLNAHHIERFSDNKKIRFDIDNGITLCEKCHKLTYKKEKDFERIFKHIIKRSKDVLRLLW